MHQTYTDLGICIYELTVQASNTIKDNTKNASSFLDFASLTQRIPRQPFARPGFSKVTLVGYTCLLCY